MQAPTTVVIASPHGPAAGRFDRGRRFPVWALVRRVAPLLVLLSFAAPAGAATPLNLPVAHLSGGGPKAARRLAAKGFSTESIEAAIGRLDL